MKKLLFFLLPLFLCLGIRVLGQPTPSPFPYYETFMFSTAKDIEFGGSPVAFLTAGAPLNEGEGQGFLRLTTNTTNQKGSVFSKTKFPSGQGLSIEFEYFTYGTSNADGICFFLYNAAVVPTIGGFGGSLGYAPYNGQGETSPGLKGAYIGVGLDEYGNFATNTQGRITGINDIRSNAVTLRGAETNDPATSYKFLTTVRTQYDIPGQPAFAVESESQQRILDTADNRYRKAFINLEPRAGVGYDVTVKIKIGGYPSKIITVINKFPYLQAAPAELSYGFAGSTGVQTNSHEIRNLRINYFTPLPPVPPTAINDISLAQPISVYHDIFNNIDVLANDKKGDSDIDPATVDIVAQPKHAAVAPTVNIADGKVVYKPLAGFTGIDSLKYTVKDKNGFISNIATVYLKVSDRPKGERDSAYTLVNKKISPVPDLRVNDIDKADGINFTIVQIEDFRNKKPGSTSYISPTGQLFYEPANNFFGLDTAKYVIRSIKDNVDSDPILVKIKVNSPPVANDDHYDVSMNVNNTDPAIDYFIIKSNDTDNEDGVSLQNQKVTIINNPNAKASVLASVTGGIQYRPQLGVTGPAEVHYTITDADGAVSNIAKVFFTIHPIPVIGLAKKVEKIEEAPNNSFDVTFKFVVGNYEQVALSKVQVTDDLLAVFSGTTFNVKTGSLKTTGTLAANTAFNGKSIKDLLDANNSSLAIGQSGTIEFVVNVVKPATSVTYQNTAIAAGTFSTTGKQVTDISTDGSIPDIGIPGRPWVSSTPTPLVLPNAVKPVVLPYTKTIYVGSPPILIDVLNGATATLPKLIDRSSVTNTAPQAGAGTAIPDPANNYQLTYTPPANFVGTAAFTYKVKDTYGVESDPASVSIIVLPLPVGVDDNVPFINKGTSLTVPFNVLTNDPDGAGNDAIQLTNPTNGTATIALNGSITYTPNPNFFGTDQLTYSIKTAAGGVSLPIKVNLVVNDPPVGQNSTVNTQINTATQPIDLLALVSDSDDGIDPTSFVTANFTNGWVVPGSGNGKFIFTPNPNFTGTGSFTYTVKDTRGVASQPKTVTINISAIPNNPPVATNKTYTIIVNSPGFSIDLPSLCSDPDGNNTLVSSSATPVQSANPLGSLQPMGNGIFQYIPLPNTKGTETFTYTIQDNRGATSQPATITIIIQDIPAPKIGLAKAASVTSATNGTFDVKYTFTLKNIGANAINNISLKDDLGLTFAGTNFFVKQPISATGTLQVNNSFNGLGNIELLDPSSTLNANTTETLELTVNVKLSTKQGVFLNTAIANGVSSVDGTATTDQSTSGVKPDPFTTDDVSPKDPTIVELLFPELFIPEGFSPNSDGTNDRFVIRNANNRKIEIELFNRWGNRVYKSADYQNDWDGKCYEKLCLGQDLPTGTYYYMILLGGTTKYTGFITLNR